MAETLIVGGNTVTKRNPLGVLGLSVITLGIYYFVWWFKINKELNEFGLENSPGKAVLALIPGFLIIVPPYVTVFKTSERIGAAQQKAGLTPSVIPWLAVVITAVIGIVIPLYVQSELNKVWDAAGASAAPQPNLSPTGTSG